MASPLDSVRPHIEAAVAGLGMDLFDARFFGSGSRSVLRVTIDKAGGVTVADCERVSSAVGALLDERDFFDGRPYTLEVSSPGIDRLLKTERDFARIAGREAVLNLSVAVGGKRTVRGVIVSCEDGTVTIDIGAESVRVPLADVVSGREELRFG
ncbi:MAG: ribosome maturation factor RimP [Chitinispirillales bacterium]|jgi:ribosome maturation factor RimP|nr:ribosome maturation factor RimP [Chitinispirillales bacterium]